MIEAPSRLPRRSGGQNWSRESRAQGLQRLHELKAHGHHESTSSELIGVPRGTAQYWYRREEVLGGTPAERAFFNSPEGVAFLKQFLLALHVGLRAEGSAGLRRLQQIVELCSLDRWVANSVSSHQAVAHAVDRELMSYEQEQRTGLAQKMSPKRITLVEDETFRERMCLVAMEPVSGFIIVEQQAEHRDAKTWDAVVAEGIKGLPVEVIQATSDEARALLAHAKSGLSAPHSPDLFHVQHEAGQGVFLPLASRATAAHDAMKEAEAEAKAASARGQPAAEAALSKARHDWQAARERQERARTAIRGLSESYHPFDLATAQARAPGTVSQDLHDHLDVLDALCDEAGLGEKSRGHIAKARRVVPSMVATIAFVQQEMDRRLHAAMLTSVQKVVLGPMLVPSIYLALCAAKATQAAIKAALREKAEKLTIGLQRLPAWTDLTGEVLLICVKLATECAEIFQRSSSCVEGRNGQLSLFQHGTRALPPDRLRTLSILHNYFKRREDGSTAAGRFFGNEPEDLFEYLLRRLPAPPFPAKIHPEPLFDSSPNGC
jgi:hypothetical protein